MADITVTVASVAKTATTESTRGTAGETITAGQPVYKNSTDSNRLYKTVATVLAQAEAVGIALHAALAGQPLEYATNGDLTIPVIVTGTVYLCSGTAGGIFPSADLELGTTFYATVLGVSSSTSNLKLCIKPGRAINA